MVRPTVAIAILLGGLACGDAIGPAAPTADASRAAVSSVPRNLILIVVDTLRQDRLGCYGYPRDTSPSMDDLAASGVRFERAYATAPWTKPSVASIMTGLHPGAHGVKTLGSILPEEVTTLAEILGENGFARAGVISHTLLSRGDGFKQGFERYLESEARGHGHVSTPGVTRLGIELLQELRGEGRFFLFLHYFDPHEDYVRHPEFGWAAPRAGRLDGTQPIFSIRGQAHALDDEERRFLGDLYDEEVRFTDEGIGLVLDEVARLGLEDETLVVLTADHGEELAERGWVGHTRTLYEELVRVPLVFRLPGDAGGRVDADPVSLVSLAPTILELLGVDAAGRGFQGSSFAGRVRGEVGATGEVFAEVDYVPLAPGAAIPEARKKALIGGRFKIILDERYDAVEVYDLVDDPGERTDLAGDSELRERLLRALTRAMDLAREGAHRSEERRFDEEEIDALRALGYVSP